MSWKKDVLDKLSNISHWIRVAQGNQEIADRQALAKEIAELEERACTAEVENTRLKKEQDRLYAELQGGTNPERRELVEKIAELEAQLKQLREANEDAHRRGYGKGYSRAMSQVYNYARDAMTNDK